MYGPGKIFVLFAVLILSILEIVLFCVRVDGMMPITFFEVISPFFAITFVVTVYSLMRIWKIHHGTDNGNTFFCITLILAVHGCCWSQFLLAYRLNFQKTFAITEALIPFYVSTILCFITLLLGVHFQNTAGPKKEYSKVN